MRASQSVKFENGQSFIARAVTLNGDSNAMPPECRSAESAPVLNAIIELPPSDSSATWRTQRVFVKVSAAVRTGSFVQRSLPVRARCVSLDYRRRPYRQQMLVQ